MAKRLSILGWIGSFFISLVLVSEGVDFYSTFNLVQWISFGMRWLEGVIVTVAGVLGLFALVELLMKTFQK